MFWNAQNLGYRFLAEARRLWEMVAEKASLTTIQAGYLITAVYNVNGLDKIGRSYTIQAISMAEQFGLFHDNADEDKRFRNAKAITGWSLFSWQLWVSVIIMPYRNMVDVLIAYFVITTVVHHTLPITQPVCCQTPTRIRNGILRYGCDTLPIQRCTQFTSGIVLRQHARYI